MRKISMLLGFMMLLGVSQQAHAQQKLFIEAQTFSLENKTDITSRVGVKKYFTSIGVYSYIRTSWTLVNKTYTRKAEQVNTAEAKMIYGVTKKFSLRDTKIEAGIGAGFETDHSGIATNMYVTATDDKFTARMNVEFGKSYWYQMSVVRALNAHFAAGLTMDQMLFGPRIEYRSRMLDIWGSTGVNLDQEAIGGAMGISLRFF